MNHGFIITVFAALTPITLTQLIWVRRMIGGLRDCFNGRPAPQRLSRFITRSRQATFVWGAGVVAALTVYFVAVGLGNVNAAEAMVISWLWSVWCLIQAVISRLSCTVGTSISKVDSFRQPLTDEQSSEQGVPQSAAESFEVLDRRLDTLSKGVSAWLWTIGIALSVIVLSFTVLVIGNIDGTFASVVALVLCVLCPSLGIMLFTRWATSRQAHRAQLLWFLAMTVEKQRPLAEELVLLAGARTGRDQLRLHAIAHDLSEGLSLADALQAQPKLIAPEDVMSIRVAEQTGLLSQALRDAAVRRTRSVSGDVFGGAAVGTGLYLWLMMTVAFSILSYLMIFIVPKYKAIFNGFGTEFPAVTNFMIGVVDTMVRSGFLVLFIPLSLGLLWTCGEAYSRGWSETWLARLLGIGRHAETPRLLRRLRYAVSAKQPWSVVLRPMVLLHPRPEVRERLERVLAQVNNGMLIWPEMRDAGLLSSRDVTLLEMAEHANNLEWALGALADAKERSMTHRWRVFMVFSVPMFTFLSGLLVMFLCLAFFMPLVKLLNDLS